MNVQWATAALVPRAVRAAVRDATLAASVHNSQPWQFVLSRSRVELRAPGQEDRPRVVDPDGRWWLASLGAATANLELGLRRRLQRDVQVVVDAEAAGTPGPVVVATWGSARAELDPAEVRLHDAVPLRRTDRSSLQGPVDAVDLAAVVAAAERGVGTGPAVRVVVPDPAGSAELLGLAGDADRRWRDDPAYLAEVGRWTHRDDGRGVPASTHGAGDSSGQVPGRDFSAGLTSPGGDRPQQDFGGPVPTLLVLLTDGDGRAEWLAAGAATERAMLAATAAGLGVGFVGQLVEQDQTRDRAARVLGLPAAAAVGATVQQVLRIGPRPLEQGGRTPRMSPPDVRG
ncbi:nitroreductase family protein [Aquipuribacter sp. MA13-6]|uniref:nitroreductase family protein n=1 Tax=unclassified Aquipuribacter TaxID=2635084 RepID=UPI003EE8E7EC